MAIQLPVGIYIVSIESIEKPLLLYDVRLFHMSIQFFFYYYYYRRHYQELARYKSLNIYIEYDRVFFSVTIELLLRLYRRVIKFYAIEHRIHIFFIYLS